MFLSFVVEDKIYVDLFRGQARNANSDLQFSDYSLREPFNTSRAEAIKKGIAARIDATSTLLCLIGVTTWQSKWVDWEIRYAGTAGKRLLGVRLHSGRRGELTPFPLSTLGAPVVNWDIDAIMKHLA